MDKTTIRSTGYNRSNKTEECGIFEPFGLLVAVFTREIESRFFVAKAGFNKKKALLPAILTKIYGVN